jgi:hypothetical protein
VTLLLTCVTPGFAVQSSDRLLTLANGDVYDEAANKATLLGKFATFAYTGLARCSRVESTDELLLRCLAKNEPINALLDGLAHEAAYGIRNLPLPGTTSQRLAVRRTSFVGAGFVGMKNPAQFGRPASPDELHPFLAVISNAQGLAEEWRPVADQDFAVSVGYLPAEDACLFHAAGQRFTGPVRVALERDIRRCLDRACRPESVARLLTRAIRAVAATNPQVGPNVMCTIVRRDEVRDASGTFRGGMAPLITEVQAEAQYFKWARGGKRVSGSSSRTIREPGRTTARTSRSATSRSRGYGWNHSRRLSRSTHPDPNRHDQVICMRAITFAHPPAALTGTRLVRPCSRLRHRCWPSRTRACGYSCAAGPYSP